MSHDAAIIVEAAEKFAARHISAEAAANADHGAPAFPEQVFGHGQEAGFDRCLLPVAIGGTGFREVELCALVETLARSCAGHAMVLAVQAGVCAALQKIAAFDDPAGRARHVLEAGRPIAVALPDPGSEAGQLDITLETRGHERSGDFLLEGDGGLAVNVAASGAALLFALSPDGTPLALLLEDAPLGELEETLGLRVLPLAQVRLDGLRVERSAIIADGADAVTVYHALLSELCLVTAAGALGVMRTAQVKAVAYAAERYQSGKMIIDHSHLRSILGAMSMAVLAAEGAVGHAVDAPERLELALATKASTTKRAVQCCTDAVQVLGGYGYMRDFGLEKCMRDAAVLSLLPISNDRAELLIAARARQRVA